MDWLLTVPLLLMEIVLVMKVPADEQTSLCTKLGVSSGLMNIMGCVTLAAPACCAAPARPLRRLPLTPMARLHRPRRPQTPRPPTPLSLSVCAAATRVSC